MQVQGPTVARWQLGSRLATLRTAAGLSIDDAAARIGRTKETVWRVERGSSGISLSDLRALMASYNVPPDQHAELEDLQRHGRRRGWWAQYAASPSSSLVSLFGLESSAEQIRTYEPELIPGLVQTRAYAESLVRGLAPHLPQGEADRRVELHMARQEHAAAAQRLWIVVGESAIQRRITDKPDVMGDQLERLAECAESPLTHTVQIMPAHVVHPGLFGAFTLFQFPTEFNRSPVVYVESQAGNLYLERSEDVSRCETSFNHIVAQACDPMESLQRIRQEIKQL